MSKFQVSSFVHTGPKNWRSIFEQNPNLHYPGTQLLDTTYGGDGSKMTETTTSQMGEQKPI